MAEPALEHAAAPDPVGAAIETAPLLEVRDLTATFRVGGERLVAVDDISFDVRRSETLCVVGESGSGKSVTALSIMGLVEAPGEFRAASLLFDGVELTALSPAEMRGLRGDRIGMIFQEPMTSLNPALRIGDQIAESLIRHRGLTKIAARDRALKLLRQVRIPSPEQRIDQYPHQLSGGMRQRVMIAIAMACEPLLLIADEPTTALDVTIQAQILALMRTLREETGTAIMLITHDLGVVAEVADRVIVMYAGTIVERAPVRTLFADPQHPYTLGLLSSIPRLDGELDRLPTIEGVVPAPAAMPTGCRFHPRCVFATARCRAEAPRLAPIAPGHLVACWHAPVELHG